MARVYQQQKHDQPDEGLLLTEALTVSFAAITASGLLCMRNLRSLPMYIEAVIIRMCSSVNPRPLRSLMRSRHVDAIEAFLVLPD